tara:strand:+ start:189 stop:335 length:147 start_codon:yes stop_codon:yes gene_type:complete
MSKKEKPKYYAKDRMEYFREFHRVIAPPVVRKLDDDNDSLDKNVTKEI